MVYYENARFEPIYEIGKEYLMFAESTVDGKMQVYRCSLSKGIEDDGDELKLLGKARKSKKLKVKK